MIQILRDIMRITFKYPKRTHIDIRFVPAKIHML
jgi:hypothetical protein